MEEPLNVYTNNHLDPALATVAIALLLLSALALWLFCLAQWRLAKRAAEDAKANFALQSALRDGARFVSGRVEYAEGEKIAIRVTVTQHGVEHRGKSTSHTWTETDRTVEKRPFYLRLDSGERVRIDPVDAKVVLVDKLDKEHWVSKFERVRRAELDVGERAYAEGILRQKHDPESAGDGYRGAGTGWVLVPLRGKIHVSTEGVAKRHVLRGRAFFRALFVLPLLVAGALAPVAPFFLRELQGADALATFHGRHYFETRNSKGQITKHWVAQYAFDDERIVSCEVDESDYNVVLPPLAYSSAPYPRQIWVRKVSATNPFNAVGRGNTVHFGWWCASVALMLCVGGWVGQRHWYKRWYERTMNENSGGPLPEPSGRVFKS
jgi:hypothetical protein